jgi:hypothetical protein
LQRAVAIVRGGGIDPGRSPADRAQHNANRPDRGNPGAPFGQARGARCWWRHEVMSRRRMRAVKSRGRTDGSVKAWSSAASACRRSAMATRSAASGGGSSASGGRVGVAPGKGIGSGIG